MTEFDSLISSGLIETEGQVPSTIKIGAREYEGIFSDLSMADAAAFGGEDSTATGVFILRKALCSAKPADKIAVLVNGEKRHLSGITDDGVAWNLGISE